MQLTAQESITSPEVTTSACHKLSGSHLGTAEVHTSAGTLCSWTPVLAPPAPELPQCYQKAWTGCERQPILSKRWAEIQCSLPKAWGKHKVCSQQKPLLAIFHCLKSLSMFQEVTMEHSSQRIKVCSNTLLFLKAQHCKKEQALPSTLSLVWTQHHRNTYFASSLLLGYWQSSLSEGVWKPPPALEYMECSITHWGIEIASASATQLNSTPQHTWSLNDSRASFFLVVQYLFYLEPVSPCLGLSCTYSETAEALLSSDPKIKGSCDCASSPRNKYKY